MSWKPTREGELLLPNVPLMRGGSHVTTPCAVASDSVFFGACSGDGRPL